jgi:hypothetical protein
MTFPAAHLAVALLKFKTGRGHESRRYWMKMI